MYVILAELCGTGTVADNQHLPILLWLNCLWKLFNFSFFPQLAKVMPLIIYIAIARALTVPSVMEQLEKENMTSLFQLESVARWASVTIISLHSDSSYLPIEKGRTVF